MLSSKLPTIAAPARRSRRNSDQYVDGTGSKGRDPSPPPISSQSTLGPEGQIQISSQNTGVAFRFAPPPQPLPNSISRGLVADSHGDTAPILSRKLGGSSGGGGGGGGGGNGGSGDGEMELNGPREPFKNEPGEGHSDHPPANTRLEPFMSSSLPEDRAPPPSTTAQKRSATASRPMVKNAIDSNGTNPHAVAPLERVEPRPHVKPEFHPPKDPPVTKASFPRPPRTPLATARSAGSSTAFTPQTPQGGGINGIGTWLRQEGQSQPHKIPVGSRASHPQSSVIGVVAELMVSTPDGKGMSSHKKPGALFGQMYMVGDGSWSSRHGRKGGKGQQADDLLDAMHQALRDKPDKHIVM